jgi:hypothetical protein
MNNLFSKKGKVIVVDDEVLELLSLASKFETSSLSGKIKQISYTSNSVFGRGEKVETKSDS